MNIRLFRHVTVMPRADRVSDLIEQFGFQCAWRRLNAGFEIKPAVDHRERAVCRAVRTDVIHHNDSPCHPRLRLTERLRTSVRGVTTK